MTATYNDVRAAIEGRIATQMAVNPAYPVAYGNVPFTPPNNTPWVQAQLRFGDNTYATLLPTGSVGYNRQTGTVTLNVFTPIGNGAAANYTIAERLKDLFDRQTVSGIIFDAASGPAQVGAGVLESGASASSALAVAYFQTQLTITFEAYLQ